MAGRTPATATTPLTSSRRPARTRWWVSAAALLALSAAPGCSLLTGRKGADPDGQAGVADLLQPPEVPDLIREAAAPRGLNPIHVTGVGLVNSLPGTGGPADPSPYRDQLIEEMRRNDVKKPEEILEASSNSIVRVRATVPPGAKRGDPIDLQIDAPPGSNATNLQGGWLLDTRMRLQQVIQGRVRKGDVLALGTGSVLTRAAFQGDDDPRHNGQALVLGGGRVQSTRKLGFVIRPEYQHVKVSSDIAAAINRRFFFFDGTTRRGVAKAVEDDYVELELHPRYEGALGRYVAVVRAIGISERKANDQARLQDLSDRLKDPASASDAALQLEALGESAVPTLVAAVQSENPELRFYAAEALGFLGRREAIAPLEDAIANESAFRYPALTVLEGLDHPGVVDALTRLFDQPSIETRYGAFTTLRRRSDASRVLSPTEIGTATRLYRIESQAPPAVVVSTREVPEVVIFGEPAPVKIEKFLFGPGGMIIKPEQPGKVRISRFQVGEKDRRAVVDSTIQGLIEGIVAVGGGYGDVIAVLRNAKSEGFIVDQFAIDPLPKALRTYHREEGSLQEDDDSVSESETDPSEEPEFFDRFIGSGV
ncbi:flagellar basal body P-ring protein FlgI [Roseiconus nitratireducens]|nr:flagellar basal body P-ring protein FlgI [Roseiconus nitratireducens]